MDATRKKAETRNLLDHYCKHLLISPDSPAATRAAMFPLLDGSHVSHDAIRRALMDRAIRPAELWQDILPMIVQHPCGQIVFDDTVLDKRHATKIELARPQYSGNEHGVINGIGVVTCVYVNPITDESWPINYRVYDPDRDGKSKLDHLREMLQSAVDRGLQFSGVLMDSWYACKDEMLFIESLGKFFVCPIKSNRMVDVNGVDANGKGMYQAVKTVDFSGDAAVNGHMAKIRGFPKNHKVKLFRVVADNGDTEFVVTNLEGTITTLDVRLMCALRWKIEQFHRELKQLTGIEGCQCRKGRLQRNHIACAMRVWVATKRMAERMATTVYAVWDELLFDALKSKISGTLDSLGFRQWFECPTRSSA